MDYYAPLLSPSKPAPSTDIHLASTPKPVKIEAVTVCLNYADFLAHTLPLNLPLFDKLVVVTAPWDKDTAKVCDHYRCPYVDVHDVMPKRGEFHKGVAVNAGLRSLDKDAWIVHLDSDIALPSHFRHMLSVADLDTSMIYGCDRSEFKSFEQWAQFQAQPEPQVQGNGVFIHTTHASAHASIRIGTRVQFESRGGWLPIGFFQMWHADSGVKQYPEGHTNAGREDSLFGAQWPRSKRGFLPEIIAYHLESEAAQMAVNWSGRKTKPFGPSLL